MEINAVVELALVIVNDLVKKSTDYFSVDYGKNLPPIRGYYQRIEQVILNLITNSRQALASKDNKLSVATSLNEQGDGIRIIIADEGEGIPSENLKHVRDPFFTTKKNSGGTGLGLSISYNIIKNHGGDLRLTSKPGEGTRAEITLPLKLPRIRRGQIEIDPISNSPAFAGRRRKAFPAEADRGDLKRAGGNQTIAVQMLELSRRALNNRLRRSRR